MKCNIQYLNFEHKWLIWISHLKLGSEIIPRYLHVLVSLILKVSLKFFI